MKSRLCTRFPLLPSFVLLLLFATCNKAERSNNNVVTDPVENTLSSNTPLLESSGTQCTNAPNYGDSILFLQPVNGQYIVNPVNNTGIKGTYLSWPDGLFINSTTGAINVSRSETGVRYLVGFVKAGTRDTCVSQLILGGVTYRDGIYVLGNNDTLAKPIFNANPLLAPICDVSNDSDYPANNAGGNSKCSFDNNVPGSKANDQALRVRTLSGIINLKKSVTDGLFGPTPKNGMTKLINIFYSLNDQSNKAQQHISVKLIYYDKVSNIPATLQSDVLYRSANLMNYRIVNDKPRPPLLIIAGYAY